MTGPEIEPGWYADPNEASLDRWWGGAGWTDRTRDAIPVEPLPVEAAATTIRRAAEPDTSVLRPDILPLPDGAAAVRPDLLAPPEGLPVYPDQTAAVPLVPPTPPPISAPTNVQPPFAPLSAAPPPTGAPVGHTPPMAPGALSGVEPTAARQRSPLPWVLGGLVGVVVVLVGLVAFLLGSSGRNGSGDSSALAQIGADLTTSTTTTTAPITMTTIPPAPPSTVTVYRTAPTTPSTRPPQLSSFVSGAPTPYPEVFDPYWAPPGGNGWVVQLASLPVDGYDAAAVDRWVNGLASRGLSAVAIWSGDWQSLKSGYWVLVGTEPVSTGDEAVGFCHANGLFNRDDCFGNIVSQNPSDSSFEAFP